MIRSHNIISVFMLVYNQEDYIAQTLGSILSQKTNFPFNLVIGEDCSSDQTLSIIKKFQYAHPNKIKLVTSNKNVGLIANFIRTLKECDGKYIAICDGDDYWIDDSKLQKQVDFLEQNPDFSIVHTNHNNILQNKDLVASSIDRFMVSSFKDLVFGNYIASPTAVFRNKFRKSMLPKWISKYPYGDWPTYLIVTNDGSKIKFLSDITANYRSEIGVSSKIRKDSVLITSINLNILIDLFNDDSFEHQKKIIKKSIIKHRLVLMGAYNRRKDYFKALKCMLRSVNCSNFFYVIKLYLYSLNRSIN